MEIAGASRFSSNGHFAIKTVQFDGRVGTIEDEGCRNVKPSGQEQPQTVGPIAGRFCSSVRRGRRAAEICKMRECPRVGEIVPSCSECSGGFVTDINSVNGRERGQGSSRKCIGSVTTRHCVQVRSRFGLRGVRVRRLRTQVPRRGIRARSLPNRVGWWWHADPSHGDSEPKHHIGGR